MPDALEKAYGYHIYFWSNENEPLEPLHIHISKTPHPNVTKYWILSDGSLPSNVKKIEEKWLNHFGKLSFFK